MKKKIIKKIKHEIRTNYLGSIYGDEFLTKIPIAVKKLKAIRKKYPFDAIAFTGSSGAGFAFPLSFLLKIPLIHIRKDTECHYSGKIEGTVSSKRYIIVDDQMETGATIRNIIRIIRGDSELRGAKPIGIFLYDSRNRVKFRSPMIKIQTWFI